jgi:dihydrolipoamide dehydrogenase
VNDWLQTNVERVWAVGDAANTPLQFAHVAFAEGMAVAERIAGLDTPPIDYDGVARVTFCTPEVASVGLTEELARERGFDITTQVFNMQGLGKANILGEGGITKLVADASSGQVIGVHIVGPHATDLISEGMLVTNWEATADELASLVHPHPTLGEAIGEAALALAGKPLNT